MHLCRKKTSIGLSLVSLLCLVSSAWGASAIDALLYHVEQTYLKHKLLTLTAIEQQRPVDAAVLIGLVLRSQIPYAGREPALRPAFDELHREALQHVARLAQTTAVTKDGAGNPITKKLLMGTLNTALKSSHYDMNVNKVYGVDPGRVRLPLLLQSPSGTNRQTPPVSRAYNGAGGLFADAPPVKPSGKFFGDDSDSVSLLDKEPPKSGQKQEGLNPDRILGQWSGEGRRNSGCIYYPRQMRVAKQNDRYVATGRWGTGNSGGNIGWVLRYDTALTTNQGKQKIFFIVEQTLLNGQWIKQQCKASFESPSVFCPNSPYLTIYGCGAMKYFDWCQ